MKVKVDSSKGSCRKVLHISVPADMVVQEYDNVLNAYAQQARIKGFRPGKAPINVVEKHFEKEIKEESQDRLMPRFYREALKEEEIEPVAVVNVEDVVMEKTKGLTFKVTIDVEPQFKLPRYKRIPVQCNDVKIAEKDIDDSIRRIREESARFEDVKGRAAKEGDIVSIDYEGDIDSKAIAEIAPDCSGLGKGKDFWVMIGKQDFIPGFSEMLTGVTIDEKKKINVRFPDDYHVSTVAGKNAVYNVLVKGIRERILPDMTKEFLKEFEVDTESALRDKVRQKLLENAERQEKDRSKEQISRFLIEKTSFELPASIVEQEIQLTARNAARRMIMGGQKQEQVESRMSEIMKTAEQTSKDRIKISYILAKIALEEKIQIEQSDVDARIKLLSGYYGVTSEKLRSEMEKNDGVGRLRKEMIAEKTLDFLLEEAKVKK